MSSKDKKSEYQPELAGFPSIESSKMIDTLFGNVYSKLMVTGRLKANADMSTAINLCADLRAKIESDGGLDLWLELNDKGRKMMIQGEIDEDEKKIAKARRLLSQIDQRLLQDFVLLERVVVETTYSAMGGSRAGPERLDNIMDGFSKNFTVSMNMNKKPNYNDSEILDLRDK